MPFQDDLSVRQLKNLQRQIISRVWMESPRTVIKLSLFLGINIPKKLLEKYILSNKD